MNNLSNVKYIKKNITKEWLIFNKFRHNRLLSDGTVDVYTYRFPVLKHDKFIVLECELRVTLGDEKIDVNVFDYNTNNKYAPFYCCEYGNYDNILRKINNRIDKEIDELQISKSCIGAFL